MMKIRFKSAQMVKKWIQVGIIGKTWVDVVKSVENGHKW